MMSKIMMIGNSPETFKFCEALGEKNTAVIDHCPDVRKALEVLRTGHEYRLVLLEAKDSYGDNREIANTIQATGVMASIVFFKPYQPSRPGREQPWGKARRSYDKLTMVAEAFQDSSLVFEYRAPCKIKKSH